MSSYLGFEFDRVEELRTRLRRTDATLAAAHSDDPEAMEAVAAVQRARAVVCAWIPFVDAVTACRALEDDGAWDGGQLRAATAALARVATNTAWASSLWEAFPHWQTWCAQLAEQRAEAAAVLARPLAPDRAAARDRVLAIDATFAALAQTLRAEHALNPASDAATLLRHMDPYAAALLLPHLDGEPGRLAQLAFDIVSRWCDHAPNLGATGTVGATVDAVLVGDHAADLVFRHLLDVPGAAAAYVALAARRPDTLFSAADDPDLARRVLLAGTDPAAVSAVAAGAAIVPILDWFAAADGGPATANRQRRDAVGHDWRPVLAELVAPWLLHLSPLDRTWPGDPGRRRDAVAHVLEDAEALRTLTAAADVAVAGLVDTMSASDLRGELSLEELAAFVGMLSQLVADEQVRDARAATAAWDLWWRLGDVALNTVDRPVLGSGVRLAFDRAHDYAARHGLLGAPTPPATVHERATYQREWALTVVGAGAVDAAFRQLVGAGRLPDDATPPPVPDRHSATPQLTYERDYLDWRSQVFTGPDDPRALAVDAVKTPFLNAADAGRSLVA